MGAHQSIGAIPIRPKFSQQVSSEIRVRHSNVGCEAGWNKSVGRVIEPRNRNCCGFFFLNNFNEGICWRKADGVQVSEGSSPSVH